MTKKLVSGDIVSNPELFAVGSMDQVEPLFESAVVRGALLSCAGAFGPSFLAELTVPTQH